MKKNARNMQLQVQYNTLADKYKRYRNTLKTIFYRNVQNLVTKNQTEKYLLLNENIAYSKFTATHSELNYFTVDNITSDLERVRQIICT